MKKILLIPILLICTVNVFSQGKKDVIDKMAALYAEKAITQFQKIEAKANAKIAVLNFAESNGLSDSISSRLGFDIARRIEQALGNAIQKKKLGYTVLAINKQAENLMYGAFIPPDTKNEEESFMTKFYDNKRPDYYLCGNYSIVGDYSLISLKNTRAEANKYDLSLKSFVIPDKELSMQISENSDKLLLLSYQTFNNLSEVCDYIALQLKFQNRIQNIRMSNLTFQNSGLPTDFSDRLTAELEPKLISRAGYYIEKNTVRSIGGKVDKTPYILGGKYWQEGNKLKIAVTLTNSLTDKTTSAVVAYLPLNILLADSIAYKVEKPEAIAERVNTLDNPERKPDFDVNIWTNKGNDNVVFKEDERMTLYVKAGKPCFLRFIYILADGSKVLLLDNYPVEPHQTGQTVQIPKNFICTDPYGTETLVLYAQTEKFKPLAINEINGYSYILDDLKSVVAKSSQRGMKSEVESAERFINIVTIPKKN